MAKEIIVIFDFCETLVSFQTADSFTRQIFKRNLNLFGICVEFIRLVLEKARLNTGEVNKKLHLLKIRGFKVKFLHNQILNFYSSKLASSGLEDSLKRLEWHKSEGHFVVIVSGGYTPYLEYYAKKHGIHLAIGTDLQKKNDRLTGFYDGVDCLGVNKVVKLNEKINLSKFDLRNSFCYTDSISDLPILLLVGNRYLINPQVPDKILKLYNINPIQIP
jgi:HAD superfamily hydrolase (TIGR01490 family)